MTTNLLLAGVGPHTRLNHLPALAAGQDTGLGGTVTGIDLPAVAQQPVAYGPPSRPRLLPVIGVEPFPAPRASLPVAVRAVLDEVVVRERIGAVIVATEPSMHVPYVLWALERGLSVLLDKPLSVHAGASVNPAAAAAMHAQLLCTGRPFGGDAHLRHGHAVESSFAGQEPDRPPSRVIRLRSNHHVLVLGGLHEVIEWCREPGRWGPTDRGQSCGVRSRCGSGWKG